MSVSRLICWGAVEACGVFDDMGWLCESMVWCWSCRRSRVGVLCLVVSGGVDECWSDIDGDVGIVGDDCRFNVFAGTDANPNSVSFREFLNPFFGVTVRKCEPIIGVESPRFYSSKGTPDHPRVDPANHIAKTPQRDAAWRQQPTKHSIQLANAMLHRDSTARKAPVTGSTTTII